MPFRTCNFPRPSRRVFGLAAAGGLALLLSPLCAAAQPPEDADPVLAPWFQGLRQPATGIPCCSLADCRVTEYRTSAESYEALIDGRWLIVPAEKVLQRIDNPTGRAVVCYTPATGILCFVRPSET